MHYHNLLDEEIEYQNVLYSTRPFFILIIDNKISIFLILLSGSIR